MVRINRPKEEEEEEEVVVFFVDKIEKNEPLNLMRLVIIQILLVIL
jgi:hypothetical protein